MHLSQRNALLLAAWLLLGCSSGDPVVDGGRADGPGPAPTEAGLARCTRPGSYCTPADPCGLNPVCSDALVCTTRGRRDCDDGVPCTVDRCIPGGCSHSVQSGWCLVVGVCYESGQTVGCNKCAPETSKVAWTPLDGVPCDDKNPCTMGDRCTQGVCLGTGYNCSDGLYCTSDSCDGKGGCTSFLKPKFCKIEQVCYKDRELDPTGCYICDVSVATDKWQKRVNVCTIGSKCYGVADSDSTGCLTCDPAHNPTAWTLKPGRCLIGTLCTLKGSLHPSKCASCDPDKTTKQWTPISGASMQVSTFAAGLNNFTVSPLVKGVGWQLSGSRFISKSKSLYYGHLTKKSYDNGAGNSGTATSPKYTFASGQQAFLAFQIYVDVEKSKAYDVLTVETVEGKVLWSKAADLAASDYRRWTQVTVDLGSLAGSTTAVRFAFDTKDKANNSGEGIYIDDVLILTGCGSIGS